MNKIVAAVVALVSIVAVQAQTAATATAHAVLQSSSPENGGMLFEPPEAVQLVFSESVGSPAALEVLDAEGRALDGGELQIVNAEMRRAYDPAAFETGSYTISYQVTSADGHPISGSLSFMVHGAGSAAQASPPSSSSDPTDAEPVTVVALVLALCVALAAALVATNRLVSRQGPPISGR